jgi:pimeloyl-ACP methyl ester carboxylesterase
MAPVARELATTWGVLEPLQTATSVDGQVEELHAVLARHGELPIRLIGFSWGAWLGYLEAARHPAAVEKLVLVGSGPFEERYVSQLEATRLGRLSEGEKTELASAIRALEGAEARATDALLARLGELTSKTDTYDPIEEEAGVSEPAVVRAHLFQEVWQDAVRLRRTGELLRLGREIRCPVVAIHGDYDPHPAEGVREPLSAVLADFRFILLENCGHKPWIERRARDRFHQILQQELS